MTPMQQLVVNRMAELDLSFRRAAERSGGLVGKATLNNIVLGRHSGHFDKATLRGIAKALNLPLAHVRAVAAESMEEPSEFRLPKKAEKLTPAQRRAILAMVDALLAAEGKRAT